MKGKIGNNNNKNILVLRKFRQARDETHPTRATNKKYKEVK